MHLWCLGCPSGRYAASAGSAQCDVCPAGNRHTVNARLALRCMPKRAIRERLVEPPIFPPGACRSAAQGSLVYKSVRVMRNWACAACTPGKFTNATGSIICNECDAGKTSVANAYSAIRVIRVVTAIMGRRCVPQWTIWEHFSGDKCGEEGCSFTCPNGKYGLIVGQTDVNDCVCAHLDHFLSWRNHFTMSPRALR